VILSAWTAFECLASDLWVAGVDQGTMEIRNRVADHTWKASEAIPTQGAHTWQFDSRTHYGSWLRERGKVSFLKLEYIKSNYKIAFGDDCKNLFDTVTDGYIYALSAVRNVLTHNSGIADKQFLQMAQRFTELKEITKGQLVLLDGDLVRKLSFASLELGHALIKHVDGLLSVRA
jgi:hypothetical protein